MVILDEPTSLEVLSLDTCRKHTCFEKKALQYITCILFVSQETCILTFSFVVFLLNFNGVCFLIHVSIFYLCMCVCVCVCV